MKRAKKLLSLVLAMILVLAMGSSVMAAPEDAGTSEATTGKITINNAISGQTYTIYKMFDFQKNGDVYNYTVAPEWEDFVKEDGAAYVKINTDGYVVWNNADTGNETDTTKDFAKAALEYAKTKGLTGISKLASGSTTGSDTVTVEFTGLDLGYYLLDSTTGTLCSLDTTDNEVIIREKNEKTVVEKEVEETSTGVGEILNYTVTIDVKEGSENYALHDVMSLGLDFNNDIEVKLVSGTEESTVAAADYTVKVKGVDPDMAHKDCTFEVVFDPDYCKDMIPGTKLVVTYTATVNEDAVTYDKVNNTAKVTYGENNTIETAPSTVETPLCDLEITKVDGATKTPLTGAKFSLAKEDGTIINFKLATDEDGTEYYAVDTDEDADNTIIEVTKADGKVLIKGLAPGNYALTEEKAPEGYNKLNESITVEIERTSKATASEVTSVSLTQITVENNTGAELPSTGGIGTTIFYVLGGILVIGAGIMLIVRKRMGSEE